jgi:hypothetical protein
MIHVEENREGVLYKKDFLLRVKSNIHLRKWFSVLCS